MTVSLKQCPRCGGTGTVLRERRRLADGRPDPLDFRLSEICPGLCCGSGVVPDTRTPEREPKGPGYVADLI